MKPDCISFRAELERALAGPRHSLSSLANLGHAQGCADCRAELLREERLERLLERLPAAHVPSALPQRVLASLARARNSRAAPLDPLAEGARLANSELESLLEGVPAPRIPADLSRRVLARVAEARTPRRSRVERRRWFLLAAALLLAGTFFWAWSLRHAAQPSLELARAPETDQTADEELLIYAVERWELLHDEDLDVWLASLDPLDEFLMEVADDEAWLDPSVRTEPAGEPAAGTPGGG